MRIGQKGFTLIELLVALPIGTAILLVMVATLFQIERGKVEIAGRSEAMMDIDGAVHWLTRDMEMNFNQKAGSSAYPSRLKPTKC